MFIIYLKFGVCFKSWAEEIPARWMFSSLSIWNLEINNRRRDVKKTTDMRLLDAFLCLVLELVVVNCQYGPLWMIIESSIERECEIIECFFRCC